MKAIRILLVLCVAALICACGMGCRKGATESTVPPESPVEEPAPKPVEVPTHLNLSSPIDDSNRWLFVQSIEGNAPGGWATGSFDADRNKLTIATSDINGFAMDTSRIRINWQKLVVLSIDGKNSELRKRDYDILHFVRTPHGEWVVKEP